MIDRLMRFHIAASIAAAALAVWVVADPPAGIDGRALVALAIGVAVIVRHATYPTTAKETAR